MFAIRDIELHYQCENYKRNIGATVKTRCETCERKNIKNIHKAEERGSEREKDCRLEQNLIINKN